MEVSGSFVVESAVRSELSLTLVIADESRVQAFEVKGPAGRKEAFPTYRDRYVIGSHKNVESVRAIQSLPDWIKLGLIQTGHSSWSSGLVFF